MKNWLDDVNLVGGGNMGSVFVEVYYEGTFYPWL